MSIADVAALTSVAGFGYEGLTQRELVSQVVGAGVDVLVDVRLNPISRKPGLSKNALSAALQDAGVRYIHLRGLGNPKWNRQGFSVADPQARAVYRDLLRKDEGLRDLQVLRSLCASGLTAGLLCFEKSQQHCHRDVILSVV